MICSLLVCANQGAVKMKFPLVVKVLSYHSVVYAENIGKRLCVHVSQARNPKISMLQRFAHTAAQTSAVLALLIAS